MFFLVILEAGILKANSVFGLSIPSCIGLKKNGSLLAIGTTLSVNIFLASDPVLDNMPTLASLAKVPVFTHSEEPIKEKPDRLTKDDITRDYEYTRGNLYSIIEKGQEAIDGILEIAQESEMPRAYEVAGQLIKSVSDATDKLMDLQKKLKDVEEETKKVHIITMQTTDWFRAEGSILL